MKDQGGSMPKIRILLPFTFIIYHIYRN